MNADSGEGRHVADAQLRAAVEAVNQTDLSLYRQALALREQRARSADDSRADAGRG
jgi:hypothetical protein